MPVFVMPRSGKFQLRVTHPNLPRPYFSTFKVEDEADAYGQTLLSMLERGIIPHELMAGSADSAKDDMLSAVVARYLKEAPVTGSDAELLVVVAREVQAVRVSGVTFQWADAYVSRLKMVQKLAPGTVRKRVGALARVLDWHLRRAGVAEKVGANPLRLLAVGYSHYTELEKEQLAAEGGTGKVDVKRNYRLPPEDEAKVVQALAGVKRADRERGLVPDPALQMLFKLTLDTGLRLREAYRLRVDQIDLVKGIIAVEGSKGTRGVLKPRTVPMKKLLRKDVGVWCEGRTGLVFPFWDGTKANLRGTTSKLSFRYRTLFDYAGLEHLTEHDLRHEACCRWLELKNPKGGWVFSETEVCKIMGWTSTAMMLRYASLRGEDLANRLL